MQEFQRQILNKLLNNPGGLTYGEFHVVEGLVENEIFKIDPTSKYTVREISDQTDKINGVIRLLIAGVTLDLQALYSLKNYIKNVKIKQLNSNQLTDFGLNPHNPENFKLAVGGKVVMYMPMTMEQYNFVQGWTQPYDKDPKEPGYFIKLIQSDYKNHDLFDHPIIWVSKKLFEDSYQVNGEMRYGDALLLLKEGYCVMRKGWNGKNMFVTLRPAPGKVSVILATDELEVEHGEYTVIVNLNNKVMSVWVPSPTDHLAEDWGVFGISNETT